MSVCAPFGTLQGDEQLEFRLLAQEKNMKRNSLFSLALVASSLCTLWFASSLSAQAISAIFEQNANGQLLDTDSCGIQHFASNNNLWTQSAATGTDCRSATAQIWRSLLHQQKCAVSRSHGRSDDRDPHLHWDGHGGSPNSLTHAKQTTVSPIRTGCRK